MKKLFLVLFMVFSLIGISINHNITPVSFEQETHKSSHVAVGEVTPDDDEPGVVY